jgi:antitoxin component of MazEF toxin-antitoxin module
MLRKLFRAGNSLAVGVPRDMAGALGLGEGDYVEIECDGEAGALLIWPRAARARTLPRPEYVRAVAAFLQDYGDALAALESE